MKKKRPQIEHIFFHRDMDVDGEYFKENNEKRLSKLGRKNYHLLLPSGYDLESEFVYSKHIHELFKEISIKRVDELILEATEEAEEKSIKRLREKFLSVKTTQNLKSGVDVKDFKWQSMIDEVDSMYHKNVERYRYGKTVLGILKSKLQKEIGRNVNLFEATDFIIRPELKLIASEFKK